MESLFGAEYRRFSVTLLLLIIISLLLLATITVEIRIVRGITLELQTNRKRILSWWVMLAVCVPVFVLGGWVLSVFVLLLINLASREIFGLFGRSFTAGKAVGVLLLSSVYLLIVVQSVEPLFLYLIPLFLVLLSSMQWVSGLTALRVTVLVVTSALSTLVVLAQSFTLQQHESGHLLLILFFITACNDIVQYISGQLFGKRLIAPTVSPGKTLEGVAGGLFVTTLLALYFLTQGINLAWPAALFSGIAISLAGLLGDLYISIHKRRAGVKDSGDLIPGHGGLLDRIDSLLLTAPVFGLSLKYLN